MRHTWNFYVNEFPKDGVGDKIERSSTNGLKSIDDIFSALEPIRIYNLPYSSETRFERSDIDFHDNHKSTIIHIVNFPYEISTTIFVKICHSLFTETLDLQCEIESISMIRKMQNFTIEICVSDYNHLQNIKIIRILSEYLQRFRDGNLEDRFSIEIFSSCSRRIPIKKRKLSFKNTKDSVANTLAKRSQNAVKDATHP